MTRIAHNWRPKAIELTPTAEALTDSAGLGAVLEMFDSSPLRDMFISCLPERVGPKSKGNYHLGLTVIASFLRGHDCLADIEKFKRDPFLRKMFSEVPAPRTMGDYLRDFTEENINQLNNFLSVMGRFIREHLKTALPEEKRPGMLHLGIDSTSHVQSGEKIEGVEYNYKGEWCLDTQEQFDELGLCYRLSLRPGATKSGVGAAAEIRSTCQLAKGSDERAIIGADSAYCFQEFFHECLNQKLYFTVTAHEGTTSWQSHIKDIKNWTPWVYSAKEMSRYLEKGLTPPEVEVGHFMWFPTWAEGKICFPIVVKRTKDDNPQGTLFSEHGFKYYGVVTNFSLYSKSAQYVIEVHNQRGNLENFLREGKINFDLKHFPCLKMGANHAYALLGMVAHNLMRWMALMDNPYQPHFAKRLRDKLIIAPGKLVSHAKKTILKVPNYFYKEVSRMREAWQATPTPALKMAWVT